MAGQSSYRISEFLRRNMLLAVVATLGLSVLATYSLVSCFKEDRAAAVIYEGF
jgi:hypothetical protein